MLQKSLVRTLAVSLTGKTSFAFSRGPRGKRTCHITSFSKPLKTLTDTHLDRCAHDTYIELLTVSPKDL